MKKFTGPKGGPKYEKVFQEKVDEFSDSSNTQLQYSIAPCLQSGITVDSS